MAPIQQYGFNEQEPAIIKFWEDKQIYPKVKAKNKGGKSFYFLQGPPYTSGRLHIGHAWNNSLKDIILRYKRMKGFDVWDRGGYDMHGLPTENKVQQKFNLKTKNDIINFGMAKFIGECIEFSTVNAGYMNKDLWRIGVWLDHENAYWPIRNSFIQGEWWLIKKANENKRIYKGKKVMTWCASCETALAKHELEYEEITDESIFLKFKIKGKENEYLIIWTTTPWTIPYNMAVMVNPELDYVKAELTHRGNKEVWVVAKALVGAMMGGVVGAKFEILEEFLGEKLEGIKYEHPLAHRIPFFNQDEIKANKRIHSVILSTEYVDTSAGSGLVHCATGCGPEDYEVGKLYGIPPFNNLDERGIYQDMGEFTNLVAKKDDQKFIQILKEAGSLIETTPVEHEYAHCWRCHKPVIYRTTEQWFLKVEDLKDRINAENEKVHWIPERGKKMFYDWMKNIKDNSITRQRFWGSPVPIWECADCKDYLVIGDANELAELSGQKLPDDLHKPWIDNITIPCECGGTKHRVPDVLDVWIDAGTASWNCLDWPTNKDLMPKLFPADLILEATEQVKLWFSMLALASFVSMDTPSFKNVYMHGMILDYQGTKMSKSMGNIISPYEVMEKHGADVLRYYMCSTNSGQNINFSWDDIKLKQRNLLILWNVHKLLIENCELYGINPAALTDKVYDKMTIAESYILSRLHSTIQQITELYDAYRIDEVVEPMEKLFLDLSRKYIQFVRDTLSDGEDAERRLVLKTIYTVLMEFLKMFSTFCPFITETIYQNLKEAFNLNEESIHLCDWPKADKKLIDKDLESGFDISESIIQAILNSREKIQLGVRWPLLEAIVVCEDEPTLNALEQLSDIVRSQTNLKDLILLKEFKEVRFLVKFNTSQLGKDYASDAKKILDYLSKKTPETVYKTIKQQGSMTINIDKNQYTIRMEHLIVTKEIAANLILTELKGIDIYVNKERTLELDAEGFSREAMRRIQDLRKKNGFVKLDQIDLLIVVPTDIKELFAKYKDAIAKKVGAVDIKITSEMPTDVNYEFKLSEAIKKKEFSFYFNKV